MARTTRETLCTCGFVMMGRFWKRLKKSILNPENAAYATRWVLRAHLWSHMLDVVHNIIHLGREGWPGTRSSAYVVCYYLLSYLVRQDWSPTKTLTCNSLRFIWERMKNISKRRPCISPAPPVDPASLFYLEQIAWLVHWERLVHSIATKHTVVLFVFNLYLHFSSANWPEGIEKKEHVWTHAATPKNPTESRFKMQLKSRLNPIKNSTCAPLSVVCTSDPQLAGAHIIYWAWNMAIWA